MNFEQMISKAVNDRDKEAEDDIFREFDATQLYCPKCKAAMPVRKRLLLILPDGDKYEYRCARCAESVGTKMVHQKKPLSIIA